ncbi:MAG: 2-oxoacid:acceptor oxidoreductase subunit alpha [Desulfobacterales bacterium]|nr:2-oxoacid:acceptor oxidoreductase subunit alpha [Desulfobacterales bacterium]
MGNDITILIGGKAGQGIQTIGAILANICHDAGLFVFSTDDFQSRIRGGHSFHLLRIGSRPLSAPSLRPHILVAIDENTFDIHREKLMPGGIAVLNKNGGNGGGTEGKVYRIPLQDLAAEAGGKIASNTVAAGVVAAAMGAGLERVRGVISKWFETKGERIQALNLTAVEKGFEQGQEICFQSPFSFDGERSPDHVVMTGSKAAALGALAADCRFFPFYPMSPGTGIVTELAANSVDLPVVMEQAEDEIAAVNMAVGAAYTGIRSLVATSGGGFSLMVEGLGLSGITETPVVIINAQRPGPATGLATRTAQADLLFSIHASQDEFPRFVFAPGSVLDTFKTVKRAVMLSEKYQVPAIVLMDQYLADSARTETNDFVVGDEHRSFIQDTEMYQDETYHRYKVTEDGISPRCRPCTPHALVRVAGNEHTPDGLPSEAPENRVTMVDKRFAKVPAMVSDMRLPSVFCNNSTFFLTGWGSSKGVIMEACLQLREEGIDAGWILFEDIWPLDADGLKEVLGGKRLIMVEGNATGQLGTLIRTLTGIEYAAAILKYDGRPIYPEYIVERVKEIQVK